MSGLRDLDPTTPAYPIACFTTRIKKIHDAPTGQYARPNTERRALHAWFAYGDSVFPRAWDPDRRPVTRGFAAVCGLPIAAAGLLSNALLFGLPAIHVSTNYISSDSRALHTDRSVRRRCIRDELNGLEPQLLSSDAFMHLSPQEQGRTLEACESAMAVLGDIAAEWEMRHPAMVLQKRVASWRKAMAAHGMSAPVQGIAVGIQSKQL